MTSLQYGGIRFIGTAIFKKKICDFKCTFDLINKNSKVCVKNNLINKLLQLYLKLFIKFYFK